MKAVCLLFTGDHIWMNADPLLRNTVNCFPSLSLLFSMRHGGPFDGVGRVVCVRGV